MSYRPPVALPELGQHISQQELRSALCQCDPSVQCRFRVNGKQHVLSMPEARRAYQRRRHCMIGAIKTHTWANNRPTGGLSPLGSKADPAFAFWYDRNHGDECTLPEPLVAGLKSAVEMACFDVQILCHQKITNLLLGVRPVPCESIPRERLVELVDAGVPIPWISVFARASALLGQSGWMIDCDSMWLRKPEVVMEGPAYGHVFGSMQAQGLRHGPEKSARHWLLNYLKEPGDKLYLSTPFRFPKGSPMLEEFVDWMRQLLLEGRLAHPQVSNYNTIMQKAVDLIQTWGLEKAITESHVFSPIPYWCRKEKLFRPLADQDTHLIETMGQSTCVNTFWLSSRAHSDVPTLEGMHPLSIWKQVLTLATPQPRGVKRRRIGKSIPWPPIPAICCISLPSMPAPDCSDLCKRYKLRKQIAEGSYGKVYQAEDNDYNKVAVKIVQRGRSPVDSREIYFTKHCQGHPHIVKLIDGLCTPFWAAIVFELATENLHQFARRQPLHVVPWAIMCPVAHHIASGLAHMHSKQVIHRDLHGRNVLLAQQPGGLPRAVLCDFGMCAHVGEGPYAPRSMTANITAPWYRAPEVFFAHGFQIHPNGSWIAPQRDIKYSAAVDIWAWACVTVHCAAGLPVYHGDSDFETAKALARCMGVIAPVIGAQQPFTYPIAIDNTHMPRQRRSRTLWLNFGRPEQRTLLLDALALDFTKRPIAADIERQRELQWVW